MLKSNSFPVHKSAFALIYISHSNKHKIDLSDVEI